MASLRFERDIHTDTYVTCTSHTGQGRKDEGEKRDATQRHETRSDGEATTGWETEPPRTLGNRRLRPPQRIIVQQESERTYQETGSSRETD